MLFETRITLMMNYVRTVQMNSSSFLLFNFLAESIFNYSIGLLSCFSVSMLIKTSP